MAGGRINDREINALTINADEAPAVFSIEGGYKICIHPGHMKATVWGDQSYSVPAWCATFVAKALCASFVIPAKRDCVS